MESAMFQFIYLLIFLGCEYVHHQSLRLSFPSYDGFLASQTLLLNYRSLLLFSFLVNIHKWLSSSNVSEPPQRRTQLHFENQNAPFLCSSMCRPGGTEEALSPGSRKRTTVVCRHEAWRCFCLTCGYVNWRPLTLNRNTVWHGVLTVLSRSSACELAEHEWGHTEYLSVELPSPLQHTATVSAAS